jgi:hypothetical protein
LGEVKGGRLVEADAGEVDDAGTPPPTVIA